MKKNLTVAFILLILILIFYAPLFFQSGEMLHPAWDWVSQHRFWKTYANDKFDETGQIPLWNTETFSGAPYAGHPAASTYFYPLNILFLKFNPDSVFKVYLLIHSLLAGLGMYYLIRKLKFGEYVSLYGAVAFTFGAAFIAKVNYGQLSNFVVVAYLPLLFLLLMQVIEKPKFINSVLLGSVWGLQFNAGNPHLFFISFLGLGLYFIVSILLHLLKDKNYREALQKIGLMLVASLFLIGLSAGLLLPSLETTSWSLRTETDYEYSTTMSLPVWYTAAFVFPGMFGNISDDSYYGPENFTELYGYAGLLPLIFALISIVYVRKKEAYIFFGLALFMLVFSFGGNTPLFWIAYKIIPGLKLFRIPATFLFMFTFFLIIFSCYGFQFMREKMKTRSSRRIDFILYSILAGFILIFLLKPFNILLKSIKPEIFNDQIAGILSSSVLYSSIVMAVFILLFKIKLRLIISTTLFIGLLFADLFITGIPLLHTESMSKQFGKTPWLEYISNDNERYRIYDMKTVSQHKTQQYGIEKITGTDPIILRHYFRFTNLLGDLKIHKTVEQLPIMNLKPEDIKNPVVLDLLNVKYILTGSKFSERNTRFRYITEFDDEGKTVYLYENKNRMPRLWLVNRVEEYADQNEVFKRIKEINPRELALVESDGVGEIINTALINAAGTVEIKKYEPNKIEIEVNLSAPAMMVLSEVWMPGWKAKVNGKEQNVLRTDYILRGVQLPEGESKVLIYYQPVPFLTGSLITFFTIFIIMIVFVWSLVRHIMIYIHPGLTARLQNKN